MSNLSSRNAFRNGETRIKYAYFVLLGIYFINFVLQCVRWAIDPHELYPYDNACNKTLQVLT